jgi:hypothetical protein
VSVMVTCVANLADIAAPGIPGSKTFSATSTAPIDPYTVITSAFSHSEGPSGSIRPIGAVS